MRGFDAELYLRLIGERMLLERGPQDPGNWRPPIAEAAAALVAVGEIAAAEAEAVLDDYSLASTLRSDPQFHRRTVMQSARAPTPGKPLAPRRVVPCEMTIEKPDASVQVRWVSLSADTTSVAVIWRPDPSAPWNGGTPKVTLTDDRGTVETAHFSGGGTGNVLLGRLVTTGPLARDTTWIDLDGTRLGLTGEASGFTTMVEPLPGQAPAHRYLWQHLAMPNKYDRQSPHNLEPAIDALIAAGALSAEDRVLGHVRTVLDAMQGGGPGRGAPILAADGVPEPWRSLLARQGSQDGPSGSMVLGAVTPVFDGFSVAVLDLKSEPHGFSLDAEVAPGLEHRPPFDWSVQSRPFAWWARDDRGNHYLGHRANWGSSEDYGHGLIGFGPALDPRATHLAIMPTGATTRAVIGIPLHWRLGANGAGA